MGDCVIDTSVFNCDATEDVLRCSLFLRGQAFHPYQLLKQRFTLGVLSNSLEELGSQNEGTLTADFCRRTQLRESLLKPSLLKKGSRAYDRLPCLCHKCVRHGLKHLESGF